MPPLRPHRFTHLRLLVDDFPACFRFYRDALGLTPAFGGEQDVYTEFTTGHTIIAALMVSIVFGAALNVSGESGASFICSEASRLMSTITPSSERKMSDGFSATIG